MTIKELLTQLDQLKQYLKKFPSDKDQSKHAVKWLKSKDFDESDLANFFDLWELESNGGNKKGWRRFPIPGEVRKEFMG